MKNQLKAPYIRKDKNKTCIITCIDLVHWPTYKFLINGEIYDLFSKEHLVNAIKNYLGIENVLLSQSPNKEVI